MKKAWLMILSFSIIVSINSPAYAGYAKKGIDETKKGVDKGVEGTKKGVRVGINGTKKGVRTSVDGTKKLFHKLI